MLHSYPSANDFVFTPAPSSPPSDGSSSQASSNEALNYFRIAIGPFIPVFMIFLYSLFIFPILEHFGFQFVLFNQEQEEAWRKRMKIHQIGLFARNSHLFALIPSEDGCFVEVEITKDNGVNKGLNHILLDQLIGRMSTIQDEPAELSKYLKFRITMFLSFNESLLPTKPWLFCCSCLPYYFQLGFWKGSLYTMTLKYFGKQYEEHLQSLSQKIFESDEIAVSVGEKKKAIDLRLGKKVLPSDGEDLHV